MDAVLAPPEPGARVERPQYGRYFSDEGLVRGGTFWCLFLAVEKKTLAHLLDRHYEEIPALVCEIIRPSSFGFDEQSSKFNYPQQTSATQVLAASAVVT